MRSDLLSRLIALVRVEQPAGNDSATGFANRRTIRQDALAFSTLRLNGATMLVVSFDGSLPPDFAPDLVSLLHSGDKPYCLGPRAIAVLMPGTPLRRALGVAEHVRMMAEVEMAVPVALSIGIATTQACGFDLEALLASAEGAAEEARARGGNRIVVAEPAPIRTRALTG
jgi:hypothetical protein